VNEETEYRSGPQLIAFFQEFGFNDSYGQGFPSRWKYTDDRLSEINGTPAIDKCIKKIFAPVNFISRFSILDSLIKDFNQYIAFDGWKVQRRDKEIIFEKATKIDFEDNQNDIIEDEFLKREFSDIDFEGLGLDCGLTELLETRFEEIQKCFVAKASLSVIFLGGSTLEGVLLGKALQFPKEFNQATAAPKDKTGKVKQFQDWTLSNFVDVATEIGLLKEDIRKFSHSLRDFRNYIHPFEQMSSRFSPDEHTTKICLQVLKAALYQLANNRMK
jgi:hypothetical protein